VSAGTNAAGTSGGAVSPSSNLAGGPGVGIATGTGPSSAAAAANGAASGAAGDGGWGGGGYYGRGTAQERARAFSLRAKYFRHDLYKSDADCLTAAYAQQLPLEMCK
jgi:hypothetical protein